MVLCLQSHTAIKLGLVDGIIVIVTGGGKPKKATIKSFGSCLEGLT
jgi:hypothetical protein